MGTSKIFLGVCLLILTNINLFSQEEGCYFVQNFHHREYEGASQSWAIAQDKRDIIYIANNVGVIEYDGNDWRNISINNQLARCLDIDDEGRIWVGGQDEFGYLAADSTNSLVFYSMVKLLPVDLLPLGMVRQIYCHNKEVYLNTNNLAVRINANRSVNIWTPKTQFHRSYLVNGVYFVNQKGYGLTYLDRDSLIRAEGCRIFAESHIYTMLPFDDGQVLIGTQSDGFFLYDFEESKKTNHRNNLLKPFITSNDEFFKAKGIYCGVKIGDGCFAIGTFRGGVAYFNKEGEVFKMINRESGLQDDAIWFLFADNQGGLWMALNNGISYVPIKSALSVWGAEEGIKGVPQSVARFMQSIYVTTNVGLFKYCGNGFEQVEGINDLCWGLYTVEGDGYRRMLIASTGGIYASDGKNVKLIEGGAGHCSGFVGSKFFPNIIYVYRATGVGIVYNNNGEFKYSGKVDGAEGEVNSLVEDFDGDIWYGLRYKGICHVDIVNPYQLVNGNPELHVPYHKSKFDDMTVTLIDGKIMASAEGGLSKFNKKTRSFEPDSTFGVEFANGEKSIRIFEQDRFGSVWFEAYNLSPNRWIEKAIRQPDGTYTRERNRYIQIPPMNFYDVMVDPDGVEWIAATDGLFRCDGKLSIDSTRCGRVQLRNVVANKKVVYNGASFDDAPPLHWEKNKKASGIALSHSHNSLLFQYSAVAMCQQKQVGYSYKLQGYDSGWSEWSGEHRKEYTNLPYGSYQFCVRARTGIGENISETSFPFYIKKPWFLHWYSYIVYLAISVLVAILLTGLNSRRLRLNNIKLQEMVEDRTQEVMRSERILEDKNAELELQKEEILSQRDELGATNRRINDSIRYAKTIQQAVLPKLSNVLDSFGQHFLIYLPKDLVSGDFYWVSQIENEGGWNEKVVVAVVDCTGHGVPGAFMSLIGSRLLSEIVNERKVQNPAAILSELSISVKLALHQDINESFDGMDIAICSIEKKSGDLVVVTFAGANRSLYYCHRNDDYIQTIRGNRKSIGAVLPDVDREFQNWRLPLHKGDTIFLCTDGIVDQNNQHSRKYAITGLQASLLEVINKPMDEIARNVLKRFEDFKQGQIQRDDVTVLGIRF